MLGISQQQFRDAGVTLHPIFNIPKELKAELDSPSLTEHREDIIRPLKNGIAWFLELFKDDFPRTFGSLATNTGVWVAVYGSSQIELVLEVGGRLIKLGRNTYDAYQNGDRPSQFALTPVRSLPPEIQSAFFTRINGLAVKVDTRYTIGSHSLLPTSRLARFTLREFCERHKLKRKIVEADFLQRFPISGDDGAHTLFNMRGFLSTYADSPNDKSSRYVGEYLFSAQHMSDKKIYIVQNADYKNLRILTDYLAGLDAYCEHVLQNRSDRFDFTPYSDAFNW